MKKSLMIAFAISLCGVAFSEPTVGDTRAKILANLNAVESSYLKYLRGEELLNAVALLNETRGLIVGIVLPIPETSSLGNSNLLSEEAFVEMFMRVKNEPSDSIKISIIMSIGKSGKVTCSQVGRLIACFSFDHYKGELLRKIARNIIDPVNIGLMIKHINSSITRNEMVEYFANL